MQAVFDFSPRQRPRDSFAAQRKVSEWVTSFAKGRVVCRRGWTFCNQIYEKSQTEYPKKYAKIFFKEAKIFEPKTHDGRSQ